MYIIYIYNYMMFYQHILPFSIFFGTSKHGAGAEGPRTQQPGMQLCAIPRRESQGGSRVESVRVGSTGVRLDWIRKMGGFLKWGNLPKNGWFMIHNPIKMDDQWGTPIYKNRSFHICSSQWMVAKSCTSWSIPLFAGFQPCEVVMSSMWNK